MISCKTPTLIDFALGKWEADPSVRIEDAYKWLYQAILGGEHMVMSRHAAAETLKREWDSVGKPSGGEPIWEPLSPDNTIGRLNIRPFKYRSGKLGNLADAFYNSSKVYSSELERFLSVWNELGDCLLLVPAGQLSHSEWSELDTNMIAKKYPAISHSDTYRTAHQPAYRVLTGEEADRLTHLL